MGFGAVTLYRRYSTASQSQSVQSGERFLAFHLTAMAALARLTVLTGTYVIYPWYRAPAPIGAAQLAGSPPNQRAASDPVSQYPVFVYIGTSLVD
jgi:hypothetical protein